MSSLGKYKLDYWWVNWQKNCSLPEVQILNNNNIKTKKVNITGYNAETKKIYKAGNQIFYTVNLEMEFKKCIRKLGPFCLEYKKYKRWVELPYEFYKNDESTGKQYFEPLNLIKDTDLNKEFILDPIFKEIKTIEDWHKLLYKVKTTYKKLLKENTKKKYKNNKKLLKKLNKTEKLKKFDFDIELDFNNYIKKYYLDYKFPSINVISLTGKKYKNVEDIINFFYEEYIKLKNNNIKKEKFKNDFYEYIEHTSVQYRFFFYQNNPYNEYNLKIENPRLLSVISLDMCHRLSNGDKDVISVVENAVKFELKNFLIKYN